MNVHTRRLLLFLLLTQSLGSQLRADSAASAQQILAAFGGSCPSQGPWTQNVAAQSLSLAAVLQSIKSDPACASVGSALQALPTLAARASEFTARSIGIQISDLRNDETSLLVALSTTADPIAQSEIQSNLASVESTLGGFYQGSGQSATVAVNEFNALDDFANSTQVALSQLAANQTCMISHPNVAAAIASMAGSVVSGTLSAGASLATAAGVSALNALSAYITQTRLQKEINGFTDPASLTAYECAVESITGAWCSAQDAKLILQQKEASLAAAAQAPGGSGAPPQGLWDGLTLLDQDLPVFIGWLNEVRSGNDPTTQPEGDRQTAEFTRQGDVEAARAEALGVFNGGMAVFQQKLASDPSHRDAWNYERSLIDTFITKIGGSSIGFPGPTSTVASPLFDLLPVACAPYQLIGLPQQSWPTNPLSGCEPFDSFDPIDSWPVAGQTFTPDLQTVITNTLAWIANADQTVSAELSQVLQADARTIFQDAVIADQHGHSPYLALGLFVDFLGHQSDIGGYYSDTIARLKQIKVQIDRVISGGADPDNSVSKAAVAAVYQQAQLAYGPTLFQGRLQRAIRAGLNGLVETGTGVDASTAAMLLASNDLVAALETVSGSSNFAVIKEDLDHAQERGESVLRSFGQTFGEALAKGLKNYDALSERDSGSEKYRRSKAALCLMLLAFPEWPAKIPPGLCLGTQLPPEIAGGPASAQFSSSSSQLPHDKRACLYRDYLRFSEIYENSLSTQRR